jgi:hypothetical protein
MHPDPSSETSSVPSFRLFIRFLRQCHSVSAVDDGHVPYVVALTGGRHEVVQPFDLLGAQLDAVGGGVLLDAGNPLGAGNRSDVVALRLEADDEVYAGCSRYRGVCVDVGNAVERLAGQA